MINKKTSLCKFFNIKNENICSQKDFILQLFCWFQKKKWEEVIYQVRNCKVKSYRTLLRNREFEWCIFLTYFICFHFCSYIWRRWRPAEKNTFWHHKCCGFFHGPQRKNVLEQGEPDLCAGVSVERRSPWPT